MQTWNHTPQLIFSSYYSRGKAHKGLNWSIGWRKTKAGGADVAFRLSSFVGFAVFLCKWMSCICCIMAWACVRPAHPHTRDSFRSLLVRSFSHMFVWISLWPHSSPNTSSRYIYSNWKGKNLYRYQYLCAHLRNERRIKRAVRLFSGTQSHLMCVCVCVSAVFFRRKGKK